MKLTPDRKILLKRFLFVAAIGVVFVLVGFVGHSILAQTPGPAPAPDAGPATVPKQAETSDFIDYIWLALYYIISIVAGWLSSLIDVIGSLFVVIISNKTYFSEPFVLIGWGALRDLVNLLFILVLIAIAFMSILRLEQSAIKKLLPRFIAAVLLVNFSFFICQQILGFADSLANGFSGEITKFNSHIFNLVQPFTATDIVNGKLSVGNIKFESVISIAVSVVFLFLMTIVYLALTLGMMARYVVLLMLIVISPLAFLLMILPATAKLSQKFWRQYISLSFWAPAALFFIWLSLLTFSALNGPLRIIVDGSNKPVLGSTQLDFGDILGFLVVIVFMAMSLYVGKILAGNLGGYTLKAAKAMGGFAKTALTDLTGTTGLGAAAAAKYKDYRKNKAAEGAERLNDLATGFNPFNGLSSEERAAARTRATTMKLPGQTGLYAQKRLDKESAKRKKEHEDTFRGMSTAELETESAKLHKDGAGNLEKKEALYRVLGQQGLLNSHAGINAENIDSRLSEEEFDGKAAAKMRSIIAATSQKSDTGDPRLASLLRVNDPEDAQQMGAAIQQEVRDRQRKGPGAMKKFKKELFADNQMGAYALAGLEEESTLDGKPVDFSSQLNRETVNHVKGQFDDTSSYTRKLYEHIASKPAGSAIDKDINGVKTKMTSEEAQAFKNNVDNIRGETARKRAEQQKSEKAQEDAKRDQAREVRKAENEAHEEDRNRSRPTPPPPPTPWSPRP